MKTEIVRDAPTGLIASVTEAPDATDFAEEDQELLDRIDLAVAESTEHIVAGVEAGFAAGLESGLTAGTQGGLEAGITSGFQAGFSSGVAACQPPPPKTYDELDDATKARVQFALDCWKSDVATEEIRKREDHPVETRPITLAEFDRDPDVVIDSVVEQMMVQHREYLTKSLNAALRAAVDHYIGTAHAWSTAARNEYVSKVENGLASPDGLGAFVKSLPQTRVTLISVYSQQLAERFAAARAAIMQRYTESIDRAALHASIRKAIIEQEFLGEPPSFDDTAPPSKPWLRRAYDWMTR